MARSNSDSVHHEPSSRSARRTNDQNTTSRNDPAGVLKQWHIVVAASGNNLREFPDAQGVYSDYQQKEWTTTVIDSDGESHDIYTGTVVYAAPATADTPVPSVEELKEHHTGLDGENRWGLEY